MLVFTLHKFKLFFAKVDICFFILQNKIFEIIFWMTLNSVITCYLSFFCNSEECDLFFLTSLSFFKLEKI